MKILRIPLIILKSVSLAVEYIYIYICYVEFNLLLVLIKKYPFLLRL